MTEWFKETEDCCGKMRCDMIRLGLVVSLILIRIMMMLLTELVKGNLSIWREPVLLFWFAQCDDTAVMWSISIEPHQFLTLHEKVVAYGTKSSYLRSFVERKYARSCKYTTTAYVTILFALRRNSFEYFRTHQSCCRKNDAQNQKSISSNIWKRCGTRE